MLRVQAGKDVYVIRDDKVDIFDYNLKSIKELKISNVDFYNDTAIDINKNVANIYKHYETYHKIELVKPVEHFVINDYFIFSAIEDNTLSITSLVGNKIVFNTNVVKSKILKLKLLGDLLYIHSENAILILNIIQKKIIFNLDFDSQLFDTDGEHMVAYADSTIFRIGRDKKIQREKIDFEIDDLKVNEGVVLIKKENELYVYQEDGSTVLVSDNCFAFDKNGDFIFVLENDIKKYNIKNIIEGPVKFLTVDDSTTMRLIIKNAILNNFKDVEVYEAKDGQEALDVLAQHPDINVVFMDWNMPVMDGREATIKIRENPAYKHVKVIMATTEGGKDKVKEMISYGVKGYLVKPLKPTSVVPVVQKMIDLVKQEREKEKENV